VRGLLALGCVLLLTGCGGDEQTTRAEWAGQADAICADVERRLDALGEAETLPEFARILDKAIALLAEGRSKLARLDSPSADEERVQQMLTQLERMEASTRAAREAARRGDEPAVMVAIGEADSAGSQADHIARDLGAEACARP
jgi:hypothetical protein